MFSSFAQLASSLEASLSLDALQAATATVKKNDDEVSATISNENGKGGSESHSKSTGSTASEEAEILLVEEISRVSELLRLKDAECSAINLKLSDTLEELQSRKLAYTDIKNELKAAKATEKSITEAHDDKISISEREISDLREEINRQKKVSEDKTVQLSNLQIQLSAATSVENNEAGRTGDAEDTAILHHENAALKREAAQNSTMLSQANEQLRVLESALEESKITRRLNEDKLTASQRDLTSLAEELRAVQSERIIDAEALNAKIVTLETSQMQQKALYETEIESCRAKLAVMETNLSQQKISYEALMDECGRKTSADSERTSEMDDLYRSLSQASDSIEKEKSFSKSAQDELAVLHSDLIDCNQLIIELQASLTARNLSVADLQSELAEKSTTITELQAKQATLTEKTKDIVKKYSEMKTKNQNLEQAGGEKNAEAVKSLHNKESEVLSLRLKLENTERGLSDQRAMAAELAERYGETQRELARAKAAVQDHMVTIGSQQLDIEQRSKTIFQLTTEKASAAALTDSLVSAQRELEAQIGELREEKAVIQDQLRSGDDSARVLDEYKKRAQMALKKSNSASAAAVSELAVMRQAVTEAQHRVTEADEAQAQAADRCKVMEAELSRTREVVEKLEIEKEKATQAEKAASFAASEAIARVRELTALQAASVAPPVPVPTQPESKARKAQHSNDADSRETLRDTKNISSGSLTLKSAEGSDDDIVVVSSKGTSESSGEDYDALSPSLVGSGIRRTGSAAAGRRISITAASSSSSANAPKNPTEGGDDIDTARSLPDTKQSNPKGGGPSDKLYYVNELYTQMDELRREMAQRGADIESTKQELQNETAIKKKLEGRVEELLAYLDRSKKFQGDGPDSATNTEYLKNCVYRFMATTEHSERRRLAPVISTILKLTSHEKRTIEQALAAGEGEDNLATLATLGAFAGSFFGTSPTPAPTPAPSHP